MRHAARDEGPLPGGAGRPSAVDLEDEPAVQDVEPLVEAVPVQRLSGTAGRHDALAARLATVVGG